MEISNLSLCIFLILLSKLSIYQALRNAQLSGIRLHESWGIGGDCEMK